ncbi:MAG: rRNA maturation RNase YbeY [Myxococcota bacterium]
MVDAETLAADARRWLAAVGLPEAEWSIVLCDDAFIRPLNAEWRGKDSATDVLSFPQEEPVAPGRFATPPQVLGDVVVSLDTARRQATELGHSLEIEVRALLIHGLLHLIGHDHEDDPVGAEQMRQEEVRLHEVAGLPASAALVVRAG